MTSVKNQRTTLKKHHITALAKAHSALQTDLERQPNMNAPGWRHWTAFGNFQTCEQLADLGLFDRHIAKSWRERRYRIAR